MNIKQQVDYLKSVKNKEVADLFLLEQAQVIVEIRKKNPSTIVAVFIADKATDLQNQFREFGIAYEVLPHFAIEKLSSLKTSRHIIALANKKKQTLHALSASHNLVLDRIQDPGNFGTIIRSASWFGIKNIICSKDCVDLYNAKCIQACMGTFLDVNVLYEDLPAFLQTHKSISVYASSLSGKALQSIPLKSLATSFLVLGNESNGVSPEILALSQQQIMIERFGNMDSLNVSVACGILLYHLRFGA